MKYALVAYFFVSMALSAFSQVNKESKNDTIIAWSASKAIEWGDFQGKLNPDIFAYALTSYKIDIIPDNVMVDSNDNIRNYQDLTVIANFYKKQSWSISDDQGLLDHERLHFDIAELFARKIRKRFSELKAIEEKRFTVYWNEYSTLWKACRAFQKQYDLETNHGAKKNENDQWILKVKALLESIDSF